MADLITQKCVGSKRIEVHVSADAYELWPGKVVKREVILEELAHLDNVCL